MHADVRIVLADDHPLLRRGLVELLAGEPDLTLIGEASDGLEAMTLIDALRPGVAVLDIDMPGMSGLEVVTEMRRRGIPGEVIFLTIHEGREYLERALSQDVKGYVLKDSAATEIIAALRQVARGGHYISPRLSGQLVERRRAPASPREGDPASPLERLSPSERRILGLVAAYRTSREIAEELHISLRTVETHRANIAAKLELRGAHALMKFALEHLDRLA